MPIGIVGSGSVTERPPVASVARRLVALKDAGRRFAVALRPSLTATSRHAPRKLVGTEGWSNSIEHRDGRKGEHQFHCSFLGLCRLFEDTLITLIDGAY
jgi:hypothetical protein